MYVCREGEICIVIRNVIMFLSIWWKTCVGQPLDLDCILTVLYIVLEEWVFFLSSFTPLPSPLYVVLDTQHPAREGIPTKTGKSSSNHGPHQWNLKKKLSNCAEEHSQVYPAKDKGSKRCLARIPASKRCPWILSLACFVCLCQVQQGNSSSWFKRAGPSFGTAGRCFAGDETSAERRQIGLWNKINLCQVRTGARPEATVFECIRHYFFNSKKQKIQ